MAERVTLSNGGELVVDEETGEILEWDGPNPINRLEFLQDQVRECAEEESAWKQRGFWLRRSLLFEMDRDGATSVSGARYRTSRVAPKDAEALPVWRAKMALQTQFITQEQYDSLVDRTVDGLEYLDVGAARAMLEGHELTEEQFALLIERTPRQPYVRTSRTGSAEPGRARRIREEHDRA